MSFDQTYNVNWELCECLEIVYETLDYLEDVLLALEKGKSLKDAITQPFDPFHTIGKY